MSEIAPKGHGRIPHSSERHGGISKAATVALAGVVAAGGIAAYEASQSFTNSNQPAATVDVGDLAKNTPPTINGRQVVVGETPTAKPTEAPTATSTPEKPKTVAWTTDQIAKAQQEALANNKILFADTWSVDGGTATDTQTARKFPAIIIDYNTNPEGKVFNSPISGTVSNALGILSDGTKLREFFIKNGSIEVEIIAAIESQPIVQNGQNISTGEALMTLSGNRIPDVTGFSKPGYVMEEDVTNFKSTTADILHDQNGTLVTLAGK